MMITKLSNNYTKLMVVDDLPPEDSAMLQALYSRSAESAETHIEKVKKAGSGKFMSSYYVGYGHKSIADCGSTTMFFENVSLLAAKAIQDWPLYSGQETSTRYIDMSKQAFIDPVGTTKSRAILDGWMNFYTSNQDRVAKTIAERHPMKEGEKSDTYEKAVKARTFDVLRSFLPAGVTTQLSWHTNLRQAGDHLTKLSSHPAAELREITENMSVMLAELYPSSGFGQNLATVAGVSNKSAEDAKARDEWEQMYSYEFAYPHVVNSPKKGIDMVMSVKGDAAFATPHDEPETYSNQILRTRPKGCVLPHFMSDLGSFNFQFPLDFGSFRDIQRHRNGVCRMPLLTSDIGFEDWYLNQLDDQLRDDANRLIEAQRFEVMRISGDPVVRQYYTALGWQVACSVTYALPALLYVLELRSGKMIHPTLRRRILRMAKMFQFEFPDVALYIDESTDDWDIRRGTQTITEKT